MPYRLTWEPPCGVYREYFGDLTIAERRASHDEICGDVRFDELRYTITDFLAVEAFECNDTSTAITAAMHIAPLATNPQIVMAAVATRIDIIAAVQAFKALGYTNAPYEVFATLEEAREWVAGGGTRRGSRRAANGRADDGGKAA